MAQTIATPAKGHANPARTAVILLAIAQVATAAFPAFGIGTPVGDRSDAVRTLITPAGWAFSIWGALYLGAFAFAIYQALPSQRGNGFVAALRWPAAGAFLGNALWAAFVQLTDINFLSVAIIVFSLVSILTAYRRIADWSGPFSLGDRWCAILPLSALAAWLTAATIVNVAAALRYHGIDADPSSVPAIAAAIVIVGGCIAGLALARGKGNPPFALVFLWALAAIYAAGGQDAPAVAIAAGLAALLTAAGAVSGLRGAGRRHWFSR